MNRTAFSEPLTDAAAITVLADRLCLIFGPEDAWNEIDALIKLHRDPEVKRAGIGSFEISRLLNRAREKFNDLRHLSGLEGI